jgi:hypothetical protein
MAAQRKSSDRRDNEIEVGRRKALLGWLSSAAARDSVQAQPVRQSERAAAAPFAGAQP